MNNSATTQKVNSGLTPALNSYRFTALFVILFMWTGINSPLYGQDELKVIRGSSSNNSWIAFSDAPNALYHHLSGQAYELLDQRAETIAGLRGLSDWQQRQRDVRGRLREIVGPFPAKTPLNAEVVGTLDKEGYRVEHIVYESQPGFHVTSSLFIPDGLQDKGPAVIYLSGHTDNGYRSETYQHKILNLVHKGFIVFAIDPVSQGERLQYYDPESGQSIVGSSTREHSYAGAQAFITGSSLARYMIWDGIRAVDYLFSREEVDNDRIGMTGRSGGGTQTAYIAAFDERIHAAAPEAYITSFTRLLQSIGPQDAEQNFFGGIAAGLDHADLLEVRAPRPTLMITTTEDFFSIQGARETAREVSGIYEAYGEPGNFAMAEDGGDHGSTRKNREAMYAFFQEHLDNPGSAGDLEVEVLSEEELRVTPTGQVATSREDAETVFSLNRRRAARQVRELESSRTDLERHLPEVLRSARRLSGYREPGSVPEPVFTGRIPREGYAIEKYFARGEGGYPIPYLLFRPDQPTGKAVLYLHPEGKAAEAGKDGELGRLARSGHTVLAPDLLGVGEMGPGELANYTTQVKDFAATSFDVWTTSVLIGRSVTGLRAGDAVRLARLLKRQAETDQVYGVAREAMGPALLHAAAFEPSLRGVALLGPYASYRSLVTNRFYDPSLHVSAVPGALTAYDLPDLAAGLAPRKLLMAGLTDGAGNLLGADEITEHMEVVRAAYGREEAGGHLQIAAPNQSIEHRHELLREWIKK
ncbi:Acetyl xylan esterase (AXE1) [Fodinibius roseus]|uniref:Acetyl xylan esterase (AXE1) n=1 Tax=Fodinibius roseus TaxID=1194090 RepID=A0A1M4T7U7_9BACT|nr:acetylxylan esterase [Fodinibius roseus]SHE40573.1 Acetyl xylan esterase (AXE1) [Fodinibius roseus]